MVLKGRPSPASSSQASASPRSSSSSSRSRSPMPSVSPSQRPSQGMPDGAQPDNNISASLCEAWQHLAFRSRPQFLCSEIEISCLTPSANQSGCWECISPEKAGARVFAALHTCLLSPNLAGGFTKDQLFLSSLTQSCTLRTNIFGPSSPWVTHRIIIPFN